MQCRGYSVFCWSIQSARFGHCHFRHIVGSLEQFYDFLSIETDFYCWDGYILCLWNKHILWMVWSVNSSPCTLDSPLFELVVHKTPLCSFIFTHSPIWLSLTPCFVLNDRWHHRNSHTPMQWPHTCEEFWHKRPLPPTPDWPAWAGQQHVWLAAPWRQPQQLHISQALVGHDLIRLQRSSALQPLPWLWGHRWRPGGCWKPSRTLYNGEDWAALQPRGVKCHAAVSWIMKGLEPVCLYKSGCKEPPSRLKPLPVYPDFALAP